MTFIGVGKQILLNHASLHLIVELHQYGHSRYLKLRERRDQRCCLRYGNDKNGYNSYYIVQLQHEALCNKDDV
jgi:hypothetical protein